MNLSENVNGLIGVKGQEHGIVVKNWDSRLVFMLCKFS